LSEKKKNKNNNNSEEKKSKREGLIEVKGEGAGAANPPLEGEKGKERTEENKSATPLEKLQDQLAEKTREASENFDKWLRLLAEFENYKKRMQRKRPT
jgi:molecular chaperone GrpE (heat shock protein)